MGFIQESLFKYTDIENKLLWNTFLDKNLIPKIWSTVSLNKKVSRNQLDGNFQFVFTRGNIELKSRYYLVECHLVLTNWQESFVFYQCFYVYYLFLLCQTFPTPSDKILSEGHFDNKFFFSQFDDDEDMANIYNTVVDNIDDDGPGYLPRQPETVFIQGKLGCCCQIS